MSDARMLDVELLPDGVVVSGPDARVEQVNAHALRMLRVRREHVLGAPLAEVIALDDLEGNDFWTCTRPYDGFALRNRLTERSWYTADGRELLVTAALERDVRSGPVHRVVVSLRDALVRAHLDRARSDLVATVAHELRSPLTGVKGFTATLLSRWDRFSESQRLFMLQTVDSEADRLGRLVTELLDAARLDSGRMALRVQPVDLAAHVRAVLTTVSASGRPVAVVTEDSLPTAWVDADRMAQVVTNLVENAFVHGGGPVAVSVRSGADSEPGVEVHVDDEGSGFPEAIRGRVFTRFWHGGSSRGSGLGLYIVRGVVQAHRGRVTIGESPGGGARVSVWLPLGEPDSLSD